MMTTNIKTVFNHPTKGQDIRRFQLGSLEKPFDQLLGFLTELYQLSPEKFTCKYRDDDGDDCSIGSNIELIEAFRIAHQEGRSVLKVEIHVEEDLSKEDTALLQNDPTLERTHSGSSDDFVKVDVESETKDETKMPAKDVTLISIEEQVRTNDPIAPEPKKEPIIEIVTISEQPQGTSEDLIQSHQPVNKTEPPVEEEQRTQILPNVEEKQRAEPVEEKQSPLEQNQNPVQENQNPVEEKQNPVEENQKPVEEKQNPVEGVNKHTEPLAFPTRGEFFGLLADFLHDSKAMELFQLVLPGLLKLLEDVNRPSVEEVLNNIFDFAPAIKESSLCRRLLPFANQLGADPKMLPLLKDALRKLHDGSKLASFFRSGPKGSIPYMPDFVRLYNYAHKLVSQRKESDEKEIAQQPESYRVVIHRGVTCDGCQMNPIQGNRYKCYVCPNFDLCEMCEEANKHQKDHPMLKIRFPVQNRPCLRSQSQNRRTCFKATFLEDVTLPDGISCYPGITVIKTWALKNTGEARWPQGVQLKFLSGELTPERVLEVPRAEPGAVVNASVEIKLPMVAKQYTGYYRLATAEGKKFGPRFWADLIVVVPSNVEKEAKKELEKESEKPDKEVEKQTTNLDIKKVESLKVPTPATDAQIQIIPSSSEPVQLDNQGDVKQTQDPNNQQDVKNQPEPAKDQQEAPKVDIKQSETEPKKSDQPSKVVEDAQVRSPFAQQLEVLASMGFQETELNSYLLANNEGNVQRVVE